MCTQQTELGSQDPLVRSALKLWAATNLLMTGWRIVSGKVLGLKKVEEHGSPWFGAVPAPRVVQNQLDHQLEREIIVLERGLLRSIHKTMQKGRRAEWVRVFLAVVLVLHVIEKDTWRLLYWVKHKQEVWVIPVTIRKLRPNTVQANIWRHPSTARELVRKSVYMSNILLAYLHHYCAGSRPLHLDWAQDTAAEWVDDDSTVLQTMRDLKRCAATLRTCFRLVFLRN